MAELVGASRRAKTNAWTAARRVGPALSLLENAISNAERRRHQTRRWFASWMWCGLTAITDRARVRGRAQDRRRSKDLIRRAGKNAKSRGGAFVTNVHCSAKEARKIR
jgi:hypothetical protein